MFKVGILIPTTTNNRNWNTMKETYLYKFFMKSFLNTYCKQHSYTIYLGIDSNDKIYKKKGELEEIKRFLLIMKNVTIKIISVDEIERGHVTKMWNKLYKQAYEDGCDYFYQCGDDIEFLTKGWVTTSINGLLKYNNKGLTGPLDKPRMEVGGKNSMPGGIRFIQTQSFVSRNHYETFGYFFPEEIKNWYCDDWITKTYFPNHFIILKDCFLKNSGGQPRYVPDNTEAPKILYNLIIEARKKLL